MKPIKVAAIVFLGSVFIVDMGCTRDPVEDFPAFVRRSQPEIVLTSIEAFADKILPNFPGTHTIYVNSSAKWEQIGDRLRRRKNVTFHEGPFEIDWKAVSPESSHHTSELNINGGFYSRDLAAVRVGWAISPMAHSIWELTLEKKGMKWIVVRMQSLPAIVRSSQALGVWLPTPAIKWANKSPEPTSCAVTPRAGEMKCELKPWKREPTEARVAPAQAVAHL